MENQAQLHHAGVVTLEEQKSVYSVLATYFNNAEKVGMYVKGHVDGEDTFEMFMKEFNEVCKTKFIVRTSWRKAASNLPRRSRYGKSERIYWEYNSGNLEVPFTGVPFVVRSCLTKHCQFGSHYYKTTAERLAKQVRDSASNSSVAPPELKKRRNKPTKKRDCPAIMHIREVVMFPDFSLDLERMFETKYHVRQEKTNLILKLKQAIAAASSDLNNSLNGLQRFYVNLPLPEVHMGHPMPCGGLGPNIHPAVAAKIDELLSLGIYDARHVRVIVHDHVREVVLKQNPELMSFNQLIYYPTEHQIADYIYISSITVKPTIIVENDEFTESETPEAGIKGEMEGSINELMGLLQNLEDGDALLKAKDSVEKIIKTVKRKTSEPVKKRKRSCLGEEENDEPLTEVVIYQQKDVTGISLEDITPEAL
uniref:Uncharacterized protein LOC100187063 n=1 Tax=Phallusia mammillata TaxID=59560 RepID=A0A6F9DJF6_9ASCI|nr:uncharacterized protein LOC100187063 [Phallusia mammillata]